MKTKDTKKSKVVYYHDELHEDFGEIGLNRPPVPENYKYKTLFDFDKVEKDKGYFIPICYK